ncbi:MAG TPA: hypothetical protein VD886_11805, partial [Herpetosiphonaceae bacterium]|nr:hypothetical protein [Herpetosiphonaceae bacterium]
MSIIICFVDGIGLTAPAAPPWTTADLPALSGLLGGPPDRDLVIERPRLLFRAIDATLGVAGLPQSGTGLVVWRLCAGSSRLPWSLTTSRV